MNRKLFWNTLKKHFGYQTTQKKCFPFEKILNGATIAYYAGVVKVVLTHSIIAGKGNYDRETWAAGSVDIINLAESVGGNISISGMEGLSEHKGPLVYIANHMSMIDAFFLPGILLAFNDITFVVKEALLYYPFFGKVMQAVNPIAVSRENPREDLKMVLNKGLERLSSGCSVIVFPQATRNHVFDAGQFNSLGIKLAKKAGVPVVPVALKTDFQEYGRIFKDLGKINPRKTIYIKFGNPVNVDGKGHKTHEYIVKFIAENVKKWGGEVRSVP